MRINLLGKFSQIPIGWLQRTLALLLYPHVSRSASAPTSGGKTLVAELLLLRALLKHNGTMALLVVPYVALALEKRDYLRDVWSPLQVCPAADGQGEKERREERRKRQ